MPPIGCVAVEAMSSELPGEVAGLSVGEVGAVGTPAAGVEAGVSAAGVEARELAPGDEAGMSVAREEAGTSAPGDDTGAPCGTSAAVADESGGGLSGVVCGGRGMYAVEAGASGGGL